LKKKFENSPEILFFT